jgi:hypothetical protein
MVGSLIKARTGIIIKKEGGGKNGNQSIRARMPKV